jgi:hypothetical protein
MPATSSFLYNKYNCSLQQATALVAIFEDALTGARYY